MLQKIYQQISHKSYNNFGNAVILLFFLCGVVIISIANGFDLTTKLQCSVPEEVISSQDFVQLKCFSKYEASYHWKISFGVLVLFNFALVLLFSVFYASWAKSRIEKWEERTDNDALKSKTVEIQTPTTIVFKSYLSHLLLSRVFLLLLFAGAIFYRIDFPTTFSCPWHRPSRTIPCVNIMAAKKVTLAKAIASIDVVFALFALVEVMYIFRWKRINQEFSVIQDMEFCSVYILQQRKSIGTIFNKMRNCPKENVKFFKLVIQGRGSEDERERHETYDVHLDKRENQIDKIEDIFKPAEKPPKRILIVGRPGVGKTSLTKRILREWGNITDHFWYGKLVVRLEFRKFNDEKRKEQNLSSLFKHGDGVLGQNEKDLYDFINLNQDKVVVIFDGLDELDVNQEKFREEKYRPLEDGEKMSVYSLYFRLIRGDFLPNATIVTTTRRTGKALYQEFLDEFDRKLEILGFTKAEIEKFVKQRISRKKREEVWKLIKESAQLLNICYIPANCDIVCRTLKKIGSQVDNSLTLTEIYRLHVAIMLGERHRSFKDKQLELGYLFEPKLPGELQSDLIRLARKAKTALDDNWSLVFKLDEDSSSLEHCGLLEMVDDEQRLYSFLHLTLQEYLAAVHIFHVVENLSEFLGSKVKEPMWHLVIQFLAGLIGRELKRKDLSNEKSDALVEIVNDTFVQWVAPLNEPNQEDKRTALLAVKCVHEIQDSEITKAAAQKLDGGGESGFDLRSSNIEPMDCRGLFDLLIHVQNLTVLDLAGNRISDQGVHELCTLLRKGCLDNLNIANNLITIDGIAELYNVLVEKCSSLHHLNVSNNEFTDEGIRLLCEALKQENCMLFSLVIGYVYGNSRAPTSTGRTYICDALKHKNCKLIHLDVSWPMFDFSDRGEEGFEDISDLCDALRNENCKLKFLDLRWYGSYEGRREQLERASHVPGFQAMRRFRE